MTTRKLLKPLKDENENVDRIAEFTDADTIPASIVSHDNFGHYYGIGNNQNEVFDSLDQEMDRIGGDDEEPVRPMFYATSWNDRTWDFIGSGFVTEWDYLFYDRVWLSVGDLMSQYTGNIYAPQDGFYQFNFGYTYHNPYNECTLYLYLVVIDGQTEAETEYQLVRDDAGQMEENYQNYSTNINKKRFNPSIALWLNEFDEVRVKASLTNYNNRPVLQEGGNTNHWMTGYLISDIFFD